MSCHALHIMLGEDAARLVSEFCAAPKPREKEAAREPGVGGIGEEAERLSWSWGSVASAKEAEQERKLRKLNGNAS